MYVFGIEEKGINRKGISFLWKVHLRKFLRTRSMTFNDLRRAEGDPFISTGRRRSIVSPYYIYITMKYTLPFLLLYLIIKTFYSNIFNI